MPFTTDQNVSPATRHARHQRLLKSLGVLAGPVATIDPTYFVNPDLSDPDNDFTLIRAQWINGLKITGTWAESGGLRGPDFIVEIALGQNPSDSAYQQIHRETLPRLTLKHTHSIPSEQVPWEGDVSLRVGVSINSGAVEYSAPFLVRVDRIAPYEEHGIEHPIKPAPTAELVTEAELADDFFVTIPKYEDHEEGDIVYIWLEEDLPDEGSIPSLLVPPARTQAADTTIKVPSDALRNKRDGRFYLGYVLADKAGNTSALSNAVRVTLVLGTLPSMLQAPDVPAADPVIDRADADAGVYVDVPEMPAWKAGDEVTVSFGGQSLEPYKLNPGGFQALIDVPAQVLLDVFGTSAREVAVEVSYTVSRLDWHSVASPIKQVRLDLSKAGPENPGWPDPVNDKLPPVVVTSAGGQQNTIPEADLGKDASLAFTVYPDAKENDTVEIIWGTAPLLTYTLTATDLPGNDIEVPLPWAAIEKTLDQAKVEVFYRIRLPAAPEENYQQSPTTAVDLSALPLVATPVTFPEALDAGIGEEYWMLNCEGFHDNAAGQPCIAVAIPDLSQAPYNQKAGDVVSLKWKSFSGTPALGDNVTAIDPADGGELTENHVLTAEELTGFIWLVPYDPYGAVTYKYKASPYAEGMIQASYSVQAGSKLAVAPAPDNIIAAFYQGGGACAVSLHSGCVSCQLK